MVKFQKTKSGIPDNMENKGEIKTKTIARNQISMLENMT